MNVLTLSLLSALVACDRGGETPAPQADGSPSAARSPAAAPPADPPTKSSGGGLSFFGSDQDCDDRSDVDVQPVNSCISGELTCGSTITGHTEGGGSRYEKTFYQKKFCEVMVDSYKGEERIYRFSMTPQQVATIELTSDCEDLDLFVMQWSKDTCPELGHMVNACEADVSRKGGEVLLEAIKNPREFLVIVEGKRGVDAPFELTANCRSRNGP